MSSIKSLVALLFGSSVLVLSTASPLSAQSSRTFGTTIDLPSQPLAAALRSLALRSQVTIIADDAVVGNRQAPAVTGARTPEEALAAILAGSGLDFQRVANGFVVKQTAGVATSDTGQTVPDVLVTGTRIRGSAPVGSPLTVLDRKAIDDSGYTTTQQLIQAIPQNSGIGPNEGTAGVSARGGASLNQAYGSRSR